MASYFLSTPTVSVTTLVMIWLFKMFLLVFVWESSYSQTINRRSTGAQLSCLVPIFTQSPAPSRPSATVWGING